jgi:hypothetical protein
MNMPEKYPGAVEQSHGQNTDNTKGEVVQTTAADAAVLTAPSFSAGPAEVSGMERWDAPWYLAVPGTPALIRCSALAH